MSTATGKVAFSQTKPTSARIEAAHQVHRDKDAAAIVARYAPGAPIFSLAPPARSPRRGSQGKAGLGRLLGRAHRSGDQLPRSDNLLEHRSSPPTWQIVRYSANISSMEQDSFLFEETDRQPA